MNSTLTNGPPTDAQSMNGAPATDWVLAANGAAPSNRKNLSFDEVRQQVQDDEQGKWDAVVRRQDIVSKDGKLAFPLDPLGEYWESLAPTPWATGQLCSQLGIPAGYFRKCPYILQDIQLNYWLRPPLPTSETPGPETDDDGFDFTRPCPQPHDSYQPHGSYMDSVPAVSNMGSDVDASTETVKTEPAKTKLAEEARQEQWLLRAKHGTLRAVLSERYSPLDNTALLECLTPFWQPHFRIDWFALGDESLHLRIVDPTLVQEGLPQDDLMAGVHISNSEVGKRSVTVDAMVFRLVCSNGLIRQVKGKSLLRQRHIHITHERFHEQLEGAVREGMNIAAAFMSQLALTARQPLPDMEETLKRLGERWHIGREVQEKALQSIRQEPSTVQETVYGLVNGLTRAAQELAMDHRYDLEVLAGHLAERGVPAWAYSFHAPSRSMLVSRTAAPSVPPVSGSAGDRQQEAAPADVPEEPFDAVKMAREMFQAETVGR